jgi:hypothetical protein
MTPEPAPPEPATVQEPHGGVRPGPRLAAAGLAMVAGIAAIVIAILLLRGVLM